MIASQALREYLVVLGAALTVGVTPVEAKEIACQEVPYAGTAKVFDFLHATNAQRAQGDRRGDRIVSAGWKATATRRERTP